MKKCRGCTPAVDGIHTTKDSYISTLNHMTMYMFLERLYSFSMRFVFAAFSSASVMELKRLMMLRVSPFVVFTFNSFSQPCLAIVSVLRSSMNGVSDEVPLNGMSTKFFLSEISRLPISTTLLICARTSFYSKSFLSISLLYANFLSFCAYLFLLTLFSFFRPDRVRRPSSSAVLRGPIPQEMLVARSVR